jgi:hypothetical protein
MRQLVENELQLVRDASRGLTVIHVLDDEACAELAIWSELLQSVRMGHDRSHPERQVSQAAGAHCVAQLAILDRAVDAHVAEGEPWFVGEVRDQARKLFLG